MASIEDVVHGYFSNLPHPRAPSVKVGDFPVATKLATVLKFGSGHAGPQETANFWSEFQTMNQNLIAQNKMPIAPEEFTHLAQQMARSSFAYHGRPPSMYEIARLRDAHPKDVADYYAGLPDEHYPTVPAGEMARALHSARPWAQMITGSEPTKLDGAYLYHSGQSPKDFYESRRQNDGTQDQAGPHPGVAGAGDAGGQSSPVGASNPRMAPGAASTGGQQGVPSR